MPTIKDERKLVHALDRLPARLRVAFAAACAQRVLPNYERYASGVGLANPRILTSILDELWDTIEHQAQGYGLERHLELCDLLAPDTGEGGPEELLYADDAVASLAYAIGTQLNGSSQEAAWAARRACEAAEAYAESRLGAGASLAAIASHPVVRKEVRRQQLDLDNLVGAIASDDAHRVLIRQIRRRSQEDSADFF